jgi:hypothetical protein
MEKKFIKDPIICELVKKSAFMQLGSFIILLGTALHRHPILSQFNQLHILKIFSQLYVGLACSLYLLDRMKICLYLSWPPCLLHIPLSDIRTDILQFFWLPCCIHYTELISFPRPNIINETSLLAWNILRRNIHWSSVNIYNINFRKLFINNFLDGFCHSRLGHAHWWMEWELDFTFLFRISTKGME